jgi:hypothetical protein
VAFYPPEVGGDKDVGSNASILFRHTEFSENPDTKIG